MVIASISLVGCVSGPAGTVISPETAERDINTPAYLAQALTWNTNENRWQFFSWVGTRGADSCEIRINVHNGSWNVPANFDSTAATEAMINARDIWTQAIREAGIACEAVTRFESEGQTLFTSLPRIDVYFVRQVGGGSNRGATTVTLHPSTRKFSRVEINIATEYVSSGQTKDMSRDDYMCTSAHEFGHALGIFCLGVCPGHSANQNDVMYTPGRFWTLSHGDKATISVIYQGDAYYKPQGDQVFEGQSVRYALQAPGSKVTLAPKARAGSEALNRLACL